MVSTADFTQSGHHSDKRNQCESASARALSYHSRPIPRSKPIASDTASFATTSPEGKWVTSITTNSVFAKSIRESWFGSVNPDSTRRSPHHPRMQRRDGGRGIFPYDQVLETWKTGTRPGDARTCFTETTCAASAVLRAGRPPAQKRSLIRCSRRRHRVHVPSRRPSLGPGESGAKRRSLQ